MNANVVTVVGVRNGRPMLDFGVGVPPKWLIDAIRYKRLDLDGDDIRLKGRALEPGETFTEADAA